MVSYFNIYVIHTSLWHVGHFSESNETHHDVWLLPNPSTLRQATRFPVAQRRVLRSTAAAAAQRTPREVRSRAPLRLEAAAVQKRSSLTTKGGRKKIWSNLIGKGMSCPDLGKLYFLTFLWWECAKTWCWDNDDYAIWWQRMVQTPSIHSWGGPLLKLPI